MPLAQYRARPGATDNLPVSVSTSTASGSHLQVSKVPAASESVHVVANLKLQVEDFTPSLPLPVPVPVAGTRNFKLNLNPLARRLLVLVLSRPVQYY